MSNKPSRSTAIHEAGHYVAKWAYIGDAVYGDTVTIVPNLEAGTLGAVSPLEEDIDTEEGIRTYIVSLYAGAAAEQRISSESRYSEIKQGARGDDESAAQYLHLLPESEAELRDQAKEIIVQHWPTVERLAGELLQHRILNADEALYIVNNQMGELQEYRDLWVDELKNKLTPQ